MTTQDIFFYVFSGMAIFCSLFVVLAKNPIHSAFSLVLVFFCVAADYALLQAHLIATMQILVYAGAIMVLFVFVIMLLNADIRSFDLAKTRSFRMVVAPLVASLFVLFVKMLKGSMDVKPIGEFTVDKIKDLGGNTQVLSQIMFSDYILPFELTSILLLVGIAGSVALAKRKLEKELETRQ